MSIETLLTKVETWWKGTTIGSEIDADGKKAKAELESVTVADLEAAAKNIALAVLPALASGGQSTAITAGIAAAETSFAQLKADISATTKNTLVTTIVNQLQATATSAAPATAA